MKSDPSVINEQSPLDFLTEAPAIRWSRERAAVLARLNPRLYKAYTPEIDAWRRLQVAQLQAVAQVKRDAEAVAQGRRMAKSIKT